MDKHIMEMISEMFKSLSDSLLGLMEGNTEALQAAQQEQNKQILELFAAQQRVIDSLCEKITALGALQSTLFTSLSVTNPGIHAQVVKEIKKAQDQLIEQGRPHAEFVELSRYLTDAPKKPNPLMSFVSENTTTH